VRSVPREIAPGVHCLGVGRGLLRSNVYFVRAGPSWALIDAGSAKCGRTIQQAAESLFGADTPPASILLTHDHPDHAGAARELAQMWNCHAWVHPDELPMVHGDIATFWKYANPLDRWVILPLLRLLGSRRTESMVSQAGLKDVVRALGQPTDLPGLPGWEAVHTPGHTPGPQLRVGLSVERAESLRAALVHHLELAGGKGIGRHSGRSRAACTGRRARDSSDRPRNPDQGADLL
jgi:glyoxylase-like metal-dependent hydrolase (beta-lactamase superfamily II)